MSEFLQQYRPAAFWKTLIWAAAGCLVLMAMPLNPAAVSVSKAADKAENKISAREVTSAVFRASPETPADLTNRDLTYLDLSTVNFKRAKLTKSDLFGADLTDANLSGVDLSDVRLDRATITRADFSGANLEGASLRRPGVFTDTSFPLHEAPSFVGAKLARIRVVARLDGANFSGADLTRANFSRDDLKDGLMWPSRRMGMPNANFKGATLVDADLRDTVLRYSSFRDANLRGANFHSADLSLADLSGADVTGANFDGADLYGAKMTGVKGFDQAQGLAKARNLDKIKR